MHTVVTRDHHDSVVTDDTLKEAHNPQVCLGVPKSCAVLVVGIKCHKEVTLRMLLNRLRDELERASSTARWLRVHTLNPRKTQRAVVRHYIARLGTHQCCQCPRDLSRLADVIGVYSRVTALTESLV